MLVVTALGILLIALHARYLRRTTDRNSPHYSTDTSQNLELPSLKQIHFRIWNPMHYNMDSYKKSVSHCAPRQIVEQIHEHFEVCNTANKSKYAR
jgi:hypothetical protein